MKFIVIQWVPKHLSTQMPYQNGKNKKLFKNNLQLKYHKALRSSCINKLGILGYLECFNLENINTGL